MKLPLTEPQRGYTILQKGITLSDQYPRLTQFAPIGADIFVFIYPIFLIILYLHGIIKKQIESKEGALFIFFSCFISILINISIQSFFLKNRPNIDLFNQDVEETLFHGLLPNSSFPSDHAVVGMSIAIATLIWGHKIRSRHPKQGKGLVYFGYLLVLCALVMGLCRIITVVHRPSDILGGYILGIAIPLLLASPYVFPYVKKWLITPIVRLQEWLFSLISN